MSFRGHVWLLLCDYDGTLVPIRPTPEQARLSSGVRRLLVRLARMPGIRVGVISGRALSELKRLVRVRGLIYAGNHGLEIAGPSLAFVHAGARRAVPTMRLIAGQLRRRLADIPGALVESKRLTLSVHWRKVAVRSHRALQQAVSRILAPWLARRAVRVTRGKRVLEVRPPVDWDKGAALRWIARSMGVPGRRILYAGDDRTDEDAFRMVNRLGGISIFIGGRVQRTAARHRLRSPHDMERLLRSLLTRP